MSKPSVQNGLLQIGTTCLRIETPEWFAWLAESGRFSYCGENGKFTAQSEVRRRQSYWYAYRRSGGKLSKIYLGRTEELTFERLERACVELSGKALYKDSEALPAESPAAFPPIGPTPSLLPPGKVNVPVPPYILVRRPRLVKQITTPLTVIHAPSGFGKSTLLHDWKQTCGFPVAWLALDENDNVPQRFWLSLVMSLQTIQPDLGRELQAYLNSSASYNVPDVIHHLGNDLNRAAGKERLGLVLDDFHNVNNSEIYDFLQHWLPVLPSNMQLVISGHIRPPISLAQWRSTGRLTELEAHDLRFTIPEGIGYLQQYPQEPPLAHADLEKLVKHTEGWAAGLTLTAVALGKQEDRRQFIDTFSGAHIYLREYFMETVLQRSSPRVQEFLLKTAILKHLTGGLCNALTGQDDGEQILARLWEENVFIVRLEQQDWYRYHDLFAEMLLNQLQARYPEELPRLHQRAARWYREQYAPADAIYHLLATEAWEEAAALMEEMALRELEHFGEDSRLLRWLLELPEGVVQKHKNLLHLYLRLANTALSPEKIERFIAHIETSLASRSAVQTQDEREVLAEIQEIRRTWARGDVYIPPAQLGGRHDAKWALLDRLHILKPGPRKNQSSLDEQITALLRDSQSQHNLFVILMAGGVLSKRAVTAGQLRRGERIARQILEQAFALRRKLPEPASIALNVLCMAHLERNELEAAQRYLDQAEDVDPNPTSTNRVVDSAILRAKVQISMSQPKEARSTMQAIRNLHRRRPSAIWSDYELAAYEALICLRGGDTAAAETIMSEAVEGPECQTTRLVRSQIYLRQNRFSEAEGLLEDFIRDYQVSTVIELQLTARVLLTVAQMGQHKVNQAVHGMNEAIRAAAPDGCLRPFLDAGPACVPILWLVQRGSQMSSDLGTFLEEVLRSLDPARKYPQMSTVEIENLATSALISAREQEVLALLSVGFSNRQIAARLSISDSTVKTHLGNIYAKLGVESRIGAVARARELGMTRPA